MIIIGINNVCKITKIFDFQGYFSQKYRVGWEFRSFLQKNRNEEQQSILSGGSCYGNGG